LGIDKRHDKIPRTEWMDDSVALQDGVDSMGIESALAIDITVIQLPYNSTIYVLFCAIETRTSTLHQVEVAYKTQYAWMVHTLNSAEQRS